MPAKFLNLYRTDSHRRKDWDYTTPGHYFITICTQDMRPYFGSIQNGEVILNDLGHFAEQCWLKIPEHYPHVELDEFIIMPDHVHGILVLKEIFNDASRDTACRVSTNGLKDSLRQFGPQHGKSLSAIIGSYKSAVTRGLRLKYEPHFSWQQNYHDRIIRSDEELQNIRDYIRNNPGS